METEDRSWRSSLFWTAFILLTILLWCPLGYGRYGEPTLLFGMPTWAVTALALGAILFVVEWFYLFKAGTALDDDALSSIMDELSVFSSKNT